MRDWSQSARTHAMLHLFFSSLYLSARLWLSALVSPLREGRSLTGALLLVLVWPLFVALQLFHWLGFALDEIFFCRWRKVEVREPIFVIGPPRSGTTHLHHVLAQDPRATTFRLWECLFGLSVTGRRLCGGLARLDGLFGGFAARSIGRLGRRISQGMADVHPLSLDAPEEDFLVMLPLMQCFILVVVFPNAEWLWRVVRLDREIDAAHRGRLMRFYRACVQKHVYVHGPDKRFVSKNASFSGSPQALISTFPDARFLICDRDPVCTVPSQLSSIEPALRLSGFDGIPVSVRQRFLDLMVFYYAHLDRFALEHPVQAVVIDNADLHDRLADSVIAAYERLDLPMDAVFEHGLRIADGQSRSFRSGHRYRLTDFGLSEDGIRTRFSAVYADADAD